MNMKMILAIVVAVLSVLIASTAQLTDLFGSGLAKLIVTVASLANSILSSINAALATQMQIVKDVQAMPGVSCVTVNENASTTLASMAVDPENPKITPASGSKNAVKNIAAGTNQ